jgi:hypothetical protein
VQSHKRSGPACCQHPFRPEYRIKSVKLQPEGKGLDVAITPLGSMVIVPRLVMHTLIVAELEF